MTPEIRKLAEELLALAKEGGPLLPSVSWIDYAAWIGIGTTNQLCHISEHRQRAFRSYIAACSPDAITKLAREVLGQETCLPEDETEMEVLRSQAEPNLPTLNRIYDFARSNPMTMLEVTRDIFRSKAPSERQEAALAELARIGQEMGDYEATPVKRPNDR